MLGYWQLRGLGEMIRELLEYTKLPYEQIVYPEDNEDKWFKEDKPKLIQKNPAITLPYLLDGDKVISESSAILVYICHKANRIDLLGRNPDELVTLATVYGIYKDFHRQYIELVYGGYKEATWEEALVKYTTVLAGYFKKWSGVLGAKSYICGEITWVDFTIAEAIQKCSMLCPKAFEGLDNLLSYQKNIWGLPELQDYFGSNRFLLHPVNGS